MLEILRRPWPWYVAGPLIGIVVPFVFWYGGRKWGVSSAFQHLCAATLPRKIEYFRYDWWKEGDWNLAMALGILVGGFLGGRVLSRPGYVVAISARARAHLAALGIHDFHGLVPHQLFSMGALTSLPGIVVVLFGGFLVGFGARWAGGCTSGHAISGLSNLMLASLVVVIGFFIGGLISAHVILPAILR